MPARNARTGTALKGRDASREAGAIGSITGSIETTVEQGAGLLADPLHAALAAGIAVAVALGLHALLFFLLRRIARRTDQSSDDIVVRHLYRPTRLFASRGLVALLVAVYPANIHMALNAAEFAAEGYEPWTLYARLPFQLVFIAWAW